MSAFTLATRLALRLASPARWRGASALTLALITASMPLAGCAGALNAQLEATPYGEFAQRRLTHTAAGAPLAPSQPSPLPEPSPTAADPSPVDLNAPVSAADLAAFGLTAGDLSAQDAQAEGWTPSPRLTHAEARSAFLLRSSSVEAIIKRHRASFTRYSQVDDLNHLVRQYDAFAEELMTSASTPLVMPQRTAWPLRGAGRMESALAEVDIALSQARSSRKVREALVGFEVAFQDAIYWERAAGTLSATARLARQSLKVAESRYQSGRGQYMYVLFAENRLDTLTSSHRSADERADAARAQLAALLELPLDVLQETDLIPAADPSLPDRAALPVEVTQHSPALQETELSSRRAQLMVEWVERQLLPELSAGTSLTRTGAVPKRGADIMYATRAPFLAELALVKDSAEAATDSARRVIPAEADQLWASLSEALRDLSLADGAQRRRARQARDAASAAFGAGELSFFELDAAITRVLDVDLSVHRHRKSAAVAAAKLNALSGAPQ
jgi:hypothetical protein